MRSRFLQVCAALFALTLALYWPLGEFGFVNYDDPDYVTGRTITLDGIRWALTSTEAANWFPVTRISHMLDTQLFGMNSGAHHLVSAGLHGLAAVLLFGFLCRATRALWPSAFVALVFVIHPLHVEPVAWVADRKDVLCAVFWFAALWSYVWYTERPGVGRYLLVAAAFCLGLMSKSMIITFPFVLMLIDRWPLERGLKLKEKLPFFALSAGSAVMTVAAQQQSGALEPAAAFPFVVRVANAVTSYGIYLVDTFWPTRLTAFYPLSPSIDIWPLVLAAAAVVGISALVWALGRQRPYLAVGWLWFLGTLVPVNGLVQVGTKAHADRYMYVPMVGLTIMLAWGGLELLGKRAALWVAAAACLACLPITWAQESYWRNSGTLFEHALAVTTTNSIAEHNLGSYLMEEPGRLPDAILHLRAALQINPESASAHSDLGSALAKSGRTAEAIAEFQEALRLKPGSALIAENLRKAQLEDGSHGAEKHYNSGVDLLKAGRPGEAVAEFVEALRIKPEYAEAEDNLGIALTQIPGREAEARGHFAAAVRLDPQSAKAHYNLGVALSQLPGKRADAVRELEAAYRISPDAELKKAIEGLR
jgi:protein O-mannosyl-transferase